MDRVQVAGQRPVALGDLRPEEDHFVDSCQRRKVGRPRVVRHQHVREIVQMQQLCHRGLAGEVQRTWRAEPRAYVLRVRLLAGQRP